MTDWIAATQGTPDGRLVAMGLALLAAVSHAVFGALQKGRHDPWLTRGAIDVCYSLMALPLALLVVPWPEGRAWIILAAAMAIHVGYKLCQARAYSLGAFTVVLGERVGGLRAGLVILIALGAVVVEFGGR